MHIRSWVLCTCVCECKRDTCWAVCIVLQGAPPCSGCFQCGDDVMCPSSLFAESHVAPESSVQRPERQNVLWDAHWVLSSPPIPISSQWTGRIYIERCVVCIQILGRCLKKSVGFLHDNARTALFLSLPFFTKPVWSEASRSGAWSRMVFTLWWSVPRAVGSQRWRERGGLLCQYSVYPRTNIVTQLCHRSMLDLITVLCLG